ncbi:hypothetical protein JXB22_03300, partial [candidate division WOR-3 bacterium]|nr:hypothetical protein [candidate division WOR-3 bacterium]
MQRIILPCLFLGSFLFGSIAGVKQLQWIDPYGREPMRYAPWAEKNTDGSLTRLTTISVTGTFDQPDVVDIIVNAKLYGSITVEIDTFIEDLVAAGYTVQLDTITGMSHTQLRSHLASISGLVGAILVGETPVAWFETDEEFPHDLYFSDLNGTYIDVDVDGLYDNHTGSVEPEIWIGRIYARDLTWDSEVSLVKNYLHKNHAYRTGGLSVPDRALSFVDDDWSYWTTCGLDAVYTNVTVINDAYQTVASNYRTQLGTGYEWIQLCAHSSPWGSTFRYGYSGYAGTVFNYDLFGLEPYALFYNLFACSGTRFVEENHSAGWYIFVTPYGLLAIGSTKTGSMLEFEDFYTPLGQQNLCIGDAFKSWFTIWGEQSWDWFYGMNILGDPTLKPHGAIVTKAETPESSPLVDPPNRYWQDISVVAANAESDGFPRIGATPGNTPHIVWESGRSTGNGRCDIFGAYRSGSTWSSASVIGSWEYWDYCPCIGIDGNSRPIAVWASYGDGQYDLYYSIYSGAWTARQLVHPHDPAYDIRPAMVLDRNDRLWVAWQSLRNLHSDIYTCYFNGSSWSAVQQVTSFTNNETMPVMAVDSTGRPWVFYCRRYDDRSEIWGSYYTGSQWLSVGPISGSLEQAYHPAAAAAGNDSLYVAWQAYDTGNSDIYISHSLNGTTWSAPEQVTTSGASDVFPVLAAHPISSQNEVWLAYQSRQYGDWNIHTALRRSGQWHDHIAVWVGNGPDINPHMVIDNTGEVWLCWQNGQNGNWEIMAAHCSGYGIDEYAGGNAPHSLSVHPSPFSSLLHITAVNSGEQIRIYDVSGSLVA